MSGPSQVPFVAVPDALAPMLVALRELTATNVPPLALVGGLAVNLRLAVGDEAHRTTRDIDVVAGDDIPGVIDVLGEQRDPTRTQTVMVGDFEVDVISTLPVTPDYLDGLDDATRLFVAGHRFAFDTATTMRSGLAAPKQTTSSSPSPRPRDSSRRRATRSVTRVRSAGRQSTAEISTTCSGSSRCSTPTARSASQVAGAPHDARPHDRRRPHRRDPGQPRPGDAPDVDRQPEHPLRRSGAGNGRAVRRRHHGLNVTVPTARYRRWP